MSGKVFIIEWSDEELYERSDGVIYTAAESLQGAINYLREQTQEALSMTNKATVPFNVPDDDPIYCADRMWVWRWEVKYEHWKDYSPIDELIAFYIREVPVYR